VLSGEGGGAGPSAAAVAVAKGHKKNFLFPATSAHVTFRSVNRRYNMPVEDMEPGMPRWMKTTDGITKKINNAAGDDELKKILKKMQAYGMYVPDTLWPDKK
jgi:hypothetical protein